MSSRFLYQLGPGPRSELVTEPEAWTAEDEQIGAAHFAYLAEATKDGIVILTGRSQEGVGPAIVIFEAIVRATHRRSWKWIRSYLKVCSPARCSVSL